MLDFYSTAGEKSPPVAIVVSLPCPTWPTLCKAEPRLKRLREQANSAGRHTWARYENLKHDLEKLVGRRARSKALRSREAFEVAHREILGNW